MNGLKQKWAALTGAGKPELTDGGGGVDQDLEYGPKQRLVVAHFMVSVSRLAIKTKGRRLITLCSSETRTLSLKRTGLQLLIKPNIPDCMLSLSPLISTSNRPQEAVAAINALKADRLHVSQTGRRLT